MIDAKSKGLFADGIGPDDTRRPPPSIDSPAIFVLHKMGVTEPLIAISSRTFLISKGCHELFVRNKAVHNIHNQALSLGWHIKHEAPEPITRAI